MDGHNYEYIVAQYLKANGYTNTEVTKASGDYGVDVLANKGGIKYAVQCKYYSSPVGIAAVQEVVAGKAYYGCNAAMVVTNNTFTKSAKDLAQANGVILIEHVTSAGSVSSNGKFLKKFLKVVLWIVYVVISAFIIWLAVDTIKGQTFGHAIYNIVTVAVFLTSPFWIRAIWKIISQKVKLKAKERKLHKIEKDLSSLSASMDAMRLAAKHLDKEPDTRRSSTNYPDKELVRLALFTCDPDLPDCDVSRLAQDKILFISTVQINFKISFQRATELMDSLNKQGFVIYNFNEKHYEWTDKVFSQNVDGNKPGKES